jgi:hypothetical protein
VLEDQGGALFCVVQKADMPRNLGLRLTRQADGRQWRGTGWVFHSIEGDLRGDSKVGNGACVTNVLSEYDGAELYER